MTEVVRSSAINRIWKVCMTVIAIAVFAILVMAYTLISGRAQKFYLSPPLLFTAAGAVIGLAVTTPLPSGTVKMLAEASLALVLFHDAAQAHPRELLRDWKILGRMLFISLPIAMALGYVVARLLFPEVGVYFALFIAAALAPTDAGLGAPTILNPVVPARVRRLLNGESGLNDGLGTPVVFFALAAAAADSGSLTGSGSPTVSGALIQAGWEILGGAVVGIAGGYLFGRLLRAAEARNWADPTAAQIGVAVIPILMFFGAEALHVNGFIAAYIAGTAFAGAAGPQLDHDIKTTEELKTLFGFAVWVLFGMIFVSQLNRFLTWQTMLFAVLALSILRVGPIWFSLLGSGLRQPTKFFIAWFGPRGLASVVFALIAYEDFGDQLPGADVLGVIGVTVLLSVIVHGVSAPPLADRYGAWAEREKPTMESAG